MSAAAAILRLALALDRTHQQRVQEVRAQIVGGNVEITVDAQGDADVDLWAARSKVKLFEKVFDREVVFLRERSARAAPRKAANRRLRRSIAVDDRLEEDPVDAAGNPHPPALVFFFFGYVGCPRQPDHHLSLAAIGPGMIRNCREL